MTSITIGNGVTSIGSEAFDNCNALTNVTCLATTPPIIELSSFTTYGTLHVLPGYKAAYKAANYWKNFNIVEDAEDLETGIEERMLEPNGKSKRMAEDGVMYDLQGRKVQKGQKGILIQNGKKVMIQ